MIPRLIKACYYATLGPLMRLNAARHRLAPMQISLSYS